MKNEWKTAI